jgi:hypothetical protein
MKKSILVAMGLLIIISVLYRYTERYDYGVERDEAVAQKAKERNITQADLDRMRKMVMGD